MIHIQTTCFRLPNQQFWLTSKKINESSNHDTVKTIINQSDAKIKINCPESYEYVSHGSLNLVLKHLSSGLKLAFVAPTKAHTLHSKGVLSVDSADNALAVSSCEDNKLVVWDSRTSKYFSDF